METNTTMRIGRESGIDWRFLGLFTFYISLFIGLVHIPRSYDAVSRFTAAAVAAFWKLLFIPVSHSGAHVTFYDFTMEIILECTGLHYAAIFAAAILAFRGRTLSYKAVGLLAGIGAIFLLNVLRLGMLGMIGHYFADLFSFVHLYLWHALFTFFVLLLWILWVNGKINFSWLPARQVMVVAAAASLCFLLMYFSIGYYYAFLASLADVIFPVLGGVLVMPSAVIARDEMIGYISGGYVIYSTTGLYTLNFAVFAALAAGAAVRTTERRLLVKRALAGVGLMLFFHLGILFMDWTLEAAGDGLLDSVLRWCIVLSSMAAPVLSWASAVLLFRTEVRE